MAELIQNHAGVADGSAEVQSAVKDWVDGVHLRNVLARLIRWIRGDSDLRGITIFDGRRIAFSEGRNSLRFPLE